MFLLASKLLTPTGGISCPDCMGQWVWNGLSPYLIKLFLKKMKTYFLRSLCICPTLLGPAEEVKNDRLNMTFIWEIGFYFHDRFQQGLSQHYLSGWWFGTFFSMSYMGCHPSHWRTHIFQRGRYTTNQLWFPLLEYVVYQLVHVGFGECLLSSCLGWSQLSAYFWSGSATNRL